MTERENFFSLIQRRGYEHVPYGYSMCPDLQKRFDAYCAQSGFAPDFVMVNVPDVEPKPRDMQIYYDRYYAGQTFKEGTFLDVNGVAREPGSEAAYHMTKIYHPMQAFESVQEIEAYPLPDYSDADIEPIRAAAESIRAQDRIAVGMMQMTIWETAWKLRGMFELMADMMEDEEMAQTLLDRVTDNAVLRAQAYARAGVDVIYVGDDVGMQHTIMMSEALYCRYLKPRLKRVIDAARAIKPDVLIFYHSCGYVLPLIEHLIDAGIDVLNPVQPECMDFGEVYERFGDRLSFHGTIGTQTTMPFGTPEEVRETVRRNLDIAGPRGGLLVQPTHLLEPEVPVENVVAYIEACEAYRP